MKVNIFTDGACSGNPGRGGYGIIMEWVGKPYRKEYAEGYRLTTNNRMELLAVIVGLESLKMQPLDVTVFSDSKYVVDSVEKKWVFSWVKKGFKDKKNADLWKRFLKVYQKHQVKFQWIKGHNDHPQNERCDQLAVEASKKEPLLIDEAFEKGRSASSKNSLFDSDGQKQ